MQITRLLLLALLPALAAAQTAELAMQLADGSTLLSDPVGLGGGCTNCGVLPVRQIGDGRGGAGQSGGSACRSPCRRRLAAPSASAAMRLNCSDDTSASLPPLACSKATP
jgi:hypothetical protein